MALGLTPKQIIEKNEYPLLRISSQWKRVQLEKVATVQNGYAFKSSFFNKSEGLPLIRIRDINSSKTQNYYSGEYNEDFVVNNKDVLIGMDGDFNVSKWPGKKGLLNQRVCRIKHFSSYYDKSFLFICLKPYLDAIHQETSAVTVKHLSSRTIQSIPLPLPPLPIQRAIVSKIEQLFSELDNGIQNLQQAKNKIAVFRQAVLKKAFEGELTREWREKQEELDLKMVAEPNFEYNSKANKKNITLGEICTKIGSGSTPRGGRENYKTEGIPLVRSLNIHFNFIKYKDLAFIDESQAEKLKNVIIEEGDVLLNITGASIGRVNVAPKDFEGGRVNQHVSIIRPTKRYSSLFIKYYLQSPIIQHWITNENHGATRQALSKTMIESIEIPNLSIEEQHQIVQEIETRFTACEQLEKSIDESLKKAEALRQSILKKAFAGELLTEKEIEACKQEADYEPAAELLKRIEKENNKTKK